MQSPCSDTSDASSRNDIEKVVETSSSSQSASPGQEVRPLVVTAAPFRVVEVQNPHLKEPSRKSRILAAIVAIFILAVLLTISIILPLKRFSPKKSPPVEATNFPPTTIANQKFARLSRWELRNGFGR